MKSEKSRKVVRGMEKLLAQARREGRLLYLPAPYAGSRGLWFTADAVEGLQQKGHYRYGPSKWSLRSGQACISYFEQRVQNAQFVLAEIKRNVKIWEAAQHKRKV